MTIEELEQFFSTAKLPSEIAINSAVKIIDVPKFVDTQITQVKAQGQKTPAYERLMEFKRRLDGEGEGIER